MQHLDQSEVVGNKVEPLYISCTKLSFTDSQFRYYELVIVEYLYKRTPYCGSKCPLNGDVLYLDVV